MNKQQKFLHVVSILLAAFLILIFYLLGGGTSSHDYKRIKMVNNSINLDVPTPNTDELSDNRIEAVMRASQAESDDNRTQARQTASSFQWITSDNYRTADTVATCSPVEPSLPKRSSASSSSTAIPARVDAEQEKQAFIAQTRQRLAQKYGVDLGESTPSATQTVRQTVASSAASTSRSATPRATVALPASDGFYGLEAPPAVATDIRAVVHGEHRNLERGSIVKLRLLDAIEINQTLIPANTFLYGQLSFASCRAMIRIQNIQYQQAVYPFEGTIYDKDGFEGLYVPDNRIDEAARKAGSQALANTNLRIPSVSVLGSAANAVVGAVQSVAQQSVSQQKINISSNYLVTIKQSSK